MPASEITGKTSTRKLPKWAPIGGLAAVFVLLAVAYILAGGSISYMQNQIARQ